MTEEDPPNAPRVTPSPLCDARLSWQTAAQLPRMCPIPRTGDRFAGSDIKLDDISEVHLRSGPYGMISKATIVVLIVSALYSVIAFGCWVLINAPFADGTISAVALLWLVPVLAPYGLLLTGYVLSADRFSVRPVLVGSIVAMLVALPLYAIFFAPNDGEAALLFLLVPALQAIVAVIALCLALWRSRGLRTPNPTVEDDALARLTRTR